MKKIPGSIFISFFLSGLLSAAVETIPYIPQKPVIDGRLDDAAWSSLPWNSGFTKIGTKENAGAQTRFKTYHDNNHIYFAVECDEPFMDKIVCQKYSPGSSLLWTNDSVELNLVPDGVKVLSFYKFIADTSGEFVDMKALDDNTNTEKYLLYPEWDSGAEIKTARGKDKWTLEAAIPLGSMDFNSQSTSRWRLNVGRNRYSVKPAELSSWSLLPAKSHVIPKAFREVEPASLSLKRFLLDLEEFSGELRRAPDGSFEYAVAATVHNNTGSFVILNKNFTLTDPETGKAFHAAGRETLSAKNYSKWFDTIRNVQPGKYRFTYELKSNHSIPVLLKKLTRDVNLEYKALHIKVRRPAYRNNIYSTQPDKTIEAELELRENIGIPLTVELTGDNGFRETKVIPKSTGSDKVTFDGARLADGRYTLRVTGEKNGQKLSSEVKLRKLPYQKGEVWFDKDGVVHVDGKPFFPFGWYGTHGPKHGPWINSYLTLAKFSSTDKAVQEIQNRLKNHGMLTMLFPFQDLDPRGWVPSVIFKDPDTRKKGLTQAQREKIAEFVSKVGKTDGVLGWYMADEPECRDNNPLWYEEAHALISELDPYHPCIMLNWGPDGIRKYYTGCDVLLPDCYPQYFEDGSTGHARWCSSDWAKTSTALRPAWQMPLMTSWPALARDGKTRGVPADYHDQRSQFFQAVIHNVKGFNMYAWHDSQRFSSFIIGPDEIGKTLTLLKEYIFKTTTPGGVTVKTAPDMPNFQAGLKELDGKLCVIAVNTSLKGVQADFTLKKKFSGKLFVAGENRAVQVNNGSFPDNFAPKATHVYLSDETLANQVPNVQETIEAIRKHREARKKKGNLLGMGEMLEIEYILYSKGEIPAHVPKIKASSDQKFYMTQQTGSLYYLVDGLIEPNRPEYTWSPVSTDKTPWLEFTLPKAAPLKELRLYTPHGNLVSCKIMTGDGKTYQVENNTKNVISVPLSGETADKVRIEILKHKVPGEIPGDAAGKRLLTEVELY
ncbi:MAG: hypothetical protein BWY31_03601 [Lentisphaerae bacterium ADurb.Bin242]|nr:MAG: hypothetical protein BWY31_03601 [Lentisphaerae bacterium ADurb.Bin242]